MATRIRIGPVLCVPLGILMQVYLQQSVNTTYTCNDYYYFTVFLVVQLALYNLPSGTK